MEASNDLEKRGFPGMVRKQVILENVEKEGTRMNNFENLLSSEENRVVLELGIQIDTFVTFTNER
jgi:hypothetical protein